MTIVSTIATATLGWTGVETVWTPGFQAQNTTDVALVYTVTGGAPVTLRLGTHYTAALDGAGNFTAYPAAGAMPAPSGTVLFTRSSSLAQATTFQDGVPPSASSLGAALDLCALRDQELRRDINAAFSTVAAAAVSAAAAAYFAALPTVLPASHGVLWNNGGVVCVS